MYWLAPYCHPPAPVTTQRISIIVIIVTSIVRHHHNQHHGMLVSIIVFDNDGDECYECVVSSSLRTVLRIILFSLLIIVVGSSWFPSGVLTGCGRQPIPIGLCMCVWVCRRVLA